MTPPDTLRLAADIEGDLVVYSDGIRPTGPGVAIQYWRALEDVRRFARAPDDLHVPAGRWVDGAVRDGEVGFRAERYLVTDGNYETFYRDVEPGGLGAFAKAVPVVEPQ